MADREEKKVHVAEVERYGEKIIVPLLPVPMPYEIGAQILARKAAEDNQEIEIYEDIPVFPWEGALALRKAIESKFGFFFANTQTIQSFFGERKIKPKEITVQVGPNEFVTAPWGQFSLPGIDAREDDGENVVYTSTTKDDKGRWVFQLRFEIQRKYLGLARELANLVRKFAIEESIYRGKAIRLQFTDDEEMGTQAPRFMDLSKSDFSTLIYSRELEERIETELFTPIRHADSLRRLRIPLKRGILAAGPYGTGKTLLAYKTASEAVANGMTFIYLEDVRQLGDAIGFAHQYQPAVIFAEDLDRAVTGERSVQMDRVLNTIDGIDSKDTEIMVVLTTNHLDKIHEAMLRPGRLDVVLPIDPPDADAVIRLIRAYGRGLIADGENLTQVGSLLSGEIPAVIREAMERAKLSAIRRLGTHENLSLTAEDLRIAAETVVAQREMCRPAPPEATPMEKFGIAVGQGVTDAAVKALREIEQHEGGDVASLFERGNASQRAMRHIKTLTAAEKDTIRF